MQTTKGLIKLAIREQKRPPLTFWRLTFYIVLIFGSLLMAYPLVFCILGSLSTPQAYLKTVWIPMPDPVVFTNYLQFFTLATEASTWILNTLIRIAWYIFIPAITSVLCGYVFAKLKFRGRDLVFTLLLSSMMVPGIVYFIPTYIMMARFPLAGGNNILGQGGSGFINQWPSLLLTGLVNVYYIFLMRQTYYSIPRDFEEAARVDGANTFQILVRVYLPMLVPSLTVLVIFQTIAIWNDYLWPLISVGGNSQLWTTALGFQRIVLTGAPIIGGDLSVSLSKSWPFTVAIIATAPLIIMFLFLQRYFIEGVQGFSIKG